MLHRILVCASIAFVLPMFVATEAAATPQRTFVASYGSDSNACTLALPCRGFAAAVVAVADRGEVVVLDSGGYGSFTIDKSVTVTAPPGVYAGISVFTGTDGIAINAPGVVVALKGMTITGQGGHSGINFLQGAELTIENCEIANLENSGTAIAGIFAQAPGGRVVVRNTTVHDSVFVPGIWVRQGTAGETTTLVADEVTVHNCGYGVIAGGAGHGGTAEAYLTRVTITGTASGAVLADSGGATALISVANSTLSGNKYGVIVSGTATLVVATSVIVRNTSEGMYNNISGTLQSRGDNTVHDNNGGGAQTFGTIGSLAPM
jgi:parallel beta helix pectate lyase-like protein